MSNGTQFGEHNSNEIVIISESGKPGGGGGGIPEIEKKKKEEKFDEALKNSTTLTVHSNLICFD